MIHDLTVDSEGNTLRMTVRMCCESTDKPCSAGAAACTLPQDLVPEGGQTHEVNTVSSAAVSTGAWYGCIGLTLLCLGAVCVHNALPTLLVAHTLLVQDVHQQPLQGVKCNIPDDGPAGKATDADVHTEAGKQGW